MNFHYRTLEFDKILLEIASFTKSESAKEIILNLTPLKNLNDIEVSHKTILEALEILVKIGNISLLENYDIDYIIKQIKIKRSFSIADLQYLRLFLIMGRNIKKVEKSYLNEKISYPNLKEYFNNINSFDFLIDILDSVIDQDGMIVDKASPNLFKIRKELLKVTNRQKELLNSLLIKKKQYLNENIIIMRNDKYCLAVRSEDKNKVKGIVHDMSNSGTTVYIEPIEIYQLSSEISNLKMAEKLEIEIILNELLEEFHPFTNDFTLNLSMFISLDIYFSHARYSLKYDCHKPLISDEVNLVKARHPLINKEDVVPVNIKITNKHKILMITGPNTGGKTVALKTLGLLSLMALSGLLIPAEENSKIIHFSNIYADIGDAQSIVQSLSTFSSHMVNISNILNEAKENSLLLFDELGSGTDPKEGVSLAKAIIDYAISNNYYLVLTTHYSELKMFAYESPYIINASVKFDEKSLKPLYEIDYNRTGSSNALNIVKRLKMNIDVVNKAFYYLKEQKTDASEIMETFEKRLNELDDALVTSNNKENELNKLISDYEMKLTKLERDKEEILLKAKKESDIYLGTIKLKADKLINELETVSKPHELAEIKYNLKELGFKIDEPENKNLKIGDEVFIKTYRQNGIIINKKEDLYLVRFGNFELEFTSNNLTKRTEIKKPKAFKKIEQPPKESHSQGSLELDLRGFRAIDVSDAYHTFIDRALLSNLKEVKIIHGFGTGVVRKIVNDLVKNDANVKEFRMGLENEGGLGVTVITFK